MEVHDDKTDAPTLVGDADASAGMPSCERNETTLPFNPKC
jgi:hypothetical protein